MRENEVYWANPYCANVCISPHPSSGIPVVGLLIDRRPFLDVIAVAMIFGVGFGTLGLASSEGSQILGMAFFVLFRPLLYTAVSEAVAK